MIGQVVTTIAGVVVLYLCCLPLILLHELGHFAAGHLCGFVLVRIRVGPVGIGRPSAIDLDEPLRLSWYWEPGTLWTGRIVMRSKQTEVAAMRRRFSAYLLGGPMANLGSALVALPFAWQDTAAGGVAKYFAIISFLIGASNLIPFGKYGFESDGRQLWAILFDKRKREARLFDFTLAARLKELRTLSHGGQLTGAADRADALLEDEQRMHPLPESRDFQEKLREYRDRLRAAATSIATTPDGVGD